MQEKEILDEKIAHLTKLLKSPDRKEENVLYIFHEIFQLSHGGLDLQPETTQWLNESAGAFLSPQLLNVLTKLRLEVYRFKFAALHFIDIDDVIEDLSNGEVLKNTQRIPPGVIIKLKRQLLEPIQQNSQSHPTMEVTPRQQSSRKNHDVKPVFTPISFTAPCLANTPQSQGSSVFASFESPWKDNNLVKLFNRDVLLPKEDETVLFDQFCGLFRCNDGKLKHIGSGQLKLLRKPYSNKVRLVMWCTKNRKVCAHHTVTLDMKLSEVKASKYSWMWVATDLENDTLETFVASFETEEQFVEFRKVFPETGTKVFAFTSKEREPKEANSNPVFAATKPRLALSFTTPSTTVAGGLFSFLPISSRTNTAATLTKSGRSATSVDSEENDSIHHFIPTVSTLKAEDEPRVEWNEEVMYCERANLFRFSDGDWKEQGVGDIKILRRGLTGKTRFLMKRDQTLDVCLNHRITSGTTFRPKDDKSWLWTAQDFSDGVGKTKTFVLRFRDATTSEAFMTAVLKNQQSTSGRSSPVSHPAVNEANKTLTATSTAQSSPASNAVEEQEKIQKKSIFDEGKEFAVKSNVHDAPVDSHAAGYDRSNPGTSA